MREELLTILQTIRPEVDFSTSTDFINEGLLDSFDLVMLVSELDAAFGVSISGADIVPENFASLDAIQRLLESTKA